MAACREQGRQNREWGIWGGESLPERYAALGLVEADFLVPACETEMAYRRHRAMNEDCVECRMAHNARMVAYDQAARARREAKQSEANAAREAARLAIEATRPSPEHAPLRPQCGTAHGYKVHCKNRELSLIPHPECTCRAAHAAKRKGERRAGKVKPMELAAAA
jgi:hypothetical protein